MTKRNALFLYVFCNVNLMHAFAMKRKHYAFNFIKGPCLGVETNELQLDKHQEFGPLWY